MAAGKVGDRLGEKLVGKLAELERLRGVSGTVGLEWYVGMQEAEADGSGRLGSVGRGYIRGFMVIGEEY